jgi:hypothetical protein
MSINYRKGGVEVRNAYMEWKRTEANASHNVPAFVAGFNAALAQAQANRRILHILPMGVKFYATTEDGDFFLQTDGKLRSGAIEFWDSMCELEAFAWDKGFDTVRG